MSGHEQERLSAYLDDELAPDERARVADHLAACAACAARLAELAAVDPAVSTLRADAPQGYFDSFPARVRERLVPRTRPRRLPAWTWAAAAALLLAVVTPLTLRNRSAARPDVAMRAAPVVAPPTLAATAAPLESPVFERTLAEPKVEQPSRQPASRSAEAVPGQSETRFASAPAERDMLQAREVAVPPAVPPTAPAAAAPELRPAQAMTAVTGATPSSSEGAAAVGLAAGAGERGRGQAAGDRKASRAEPQAVPEAVTDEGLRPHYVQAPAPEGVAAPKRAAEAEWQRLDATRPRTTAEWRQLREAWRAFVAGEPEGRQADAARVRTIEAGLEAWRAGGDRADEAAFRRDATAYLERDDAAQKDHVGRLLTAARP